MLPIKCTFKHVRGHQDVGLTTAFNQTAWMNIEMDLLAKAMIQSNFTGPQKYQIDGEPWMCYIKGQWQIKKRKHHSASTHQHDHDQGTLDKKKIQIRQCKHGWFRGGRESYPRLTPSSTTLGSKICSKLSAARGKYAKLETTTRRQMPMLSAGGQKQTPHNPMSGTNSPNKLETSNRPTRPVASKLESRPGQPKRNYPRTKQMV